MKYFKNLFLLFVWLTVWAGGGSSWPQFQHDAKNSGFTAITTDTENLGLIWAKDLGTEISPFTSPIIGWANGEEVVYIGTTNGIYCLSSTNGEIVWFHPTTMPIIYTPVYELDRLYVPVAETLVCLNPQTDPKSQVLTP